MLYDNIATAKHFATSEPVLNFPSLLALQPTKKEGMFDSLWTWWYLIPSATRWVNFKQRSNTKLLILKSAILFSDIDDRGFASESFAHAKDWLAQPNRVVQVIHVCTVLSSHPSLGLSSFFSSDFLYYTVDLLSNHQVTRKCQSHIP